MGIWSRTDPVLHNQLSFFWLAGSSSQSRWYFHWEAVVQYYCSTVDSNFIWTSFVHVLLRMSKAPVDGTSQMVTVSCHLARHCIPGLVDTQACLPSITGITSPQRHSHCLRIFGLSCGYRVLDAGYG